jgi:hypothetical protein
MSGRIYDGHTGRHGCDLMHRMLGGPGKCRLDSGVCGMQQRAVSEQHRALELLSLHIWVERRHHLSVVRGWELDQCQRSLHSVCRWSVSA